MLTLVFNRSQRLGITSCHMKNTSSVWMNQACAPCSVQSGSRDFSSVPVILADGIWGPPHQRSPPRSQTHGDNELLSSRPTRIQCQRNHYVTKSQNILHGLFWAPISRFKSFRIPEQNHPT